MSTEDPDPGEKATGIRLRGAQGLSLSSLALFIESCACHGAVWVLLFFEFQIPDDHDLCTAISDCSFHLLGAVHFPSLRLTVYSCTHLFVPLFIHCCHALRVTLEVLASKDPGFFCLHSYPSPLGLASCLLSLHVKHP